MNHTGQVTKHIELILRINREYRKPWLCFRLYIFFPSWHTSRSYLRRCCWLREWWWPRTRSHMYLLKVSVKRNSWLEVLVTSLLPTQITRSSWGGLHFEVPYRIAIYIYKQCKTCLRRPFPPTSSHRVKAVKHKVHERLIILLWR